MHQNRLIVILASVLLSYCFKCILKHKPTSQQLVLILCITAAQECFWRKFFCPLVPPAAGSWGPPRLLQSWRDLWWCHHCGQRTVKAAALPSSWLLLWPAALVFSVVSCYLKPGCLPAWRRTLDHNLCNVLFPPSSSGLIWLSTKGRVL